MRKFEEQILNNQFHFWILESFNEKFDFNELLKSHEPQKNKASQYFVKKFALDKTAVDYVSSIISLVGYEVLEKPNQAMLKFIVDDIEGIATKYSKNVTNKVVIQNLQEILLSTDNILKTFEKYCQKNNVIYTNFSFELLREEVGSAGSYLIQKFGDSSIEIGFSDDFDVLSINSKNKKIDKIHPFKNLRINYFFFNILNVQFYQEKITSEKIDEFTDKFILPKPQRIYDTNFDLTKNVLIKNILGDISLLNDKDYQFSREEFSEEFKQKLYENIRGKTEDVNDPVLKGILNSATFEDINGVYDLILNKIPLEDLTALIIQCLMKLIPLDELKKTICRKIVSEITESELKILADFLLILGNEISIQTSKEISKLDIGENPKALLQYTLQSQDREELICLAVFAAIPAAIYLLSQLLKDENELKDKIKDDLYLVKKSVKKRIEYFFDDNIPVNDFLKSVAEVVENLAEQFIFQTVIFVVAETIDALQEACDSPEQDIANAITSPIGRVNLNDFRDRTKNSRNENDQLDELTRNFLDDLSALLSLTEICLILSDNIKEEQYRQIEFLLEKEEYKELKKILSDRMSIRIFFRELSKDIDQTLCQEALEQFEKEKKVLIELCTDTTELKQKLLEKIHEGTFSADDILNSIEISKNRNKQRIENIVDTIRGKDFIQGKCQPIHESQLYMINLSLKENIKTILKSFDQDVSGFKKIFTSNKENFVEQMNKIGDEQKPEKNKTIARKLVASLSDEKTITRNEDTNFVSLKVSGKDTLSYFSNSSVSIGVSNKKTITKNKNAKKLFSEQFLEPNELSEDVFGSMIEVVFENLLKSTMDPNKNFLILGQNFVKYPLISWEKNLEGSLCGPLFRSQIFVEYFTTFHDNFACSDVFEEPIKWSYLAMGYKMFVYFISLRECLKSIFAISVFSKNEFSNQQNNFILEMISENIKKEVLTEDEDFRKNFETILFQIYPNTTYEQAISKFVSETVPQVVDELQGRIGKKYFEDFGENNDLGSIIKISENSNEKRKGIFNQTYYQFSINKNIQLQLDEQEKNFFNIFRQFLIAKKINNGNTFGLDEFFVPGIIGTDFQKLVSIATPDSSQVDINQINYLEVGKIFEEDYLNKVDRIRNESQKITQYGELDDFGKFCVELLNFKKSFYSTINVPIEFLSNPRNYVYQFLNQKTSLFIDLISKNKRIVIISEDDSYLSSKANKKELYNKIGFGFANGLYCIEIVDDELVRISTEQYNMSFLEFMKEIPIFKENKATFSIKGTKNFADALDLNLLEDLVISTIYSKTDEIYGKEIDSIFENTKNVTKEILKIQSWNINNEYQNVPDSYSGNGIGGLPEFSVIEVVLSAFLKSAANMTDPTWKTFPLTPIGWAAKLIDSEDSDSEFKTTKDPNKTCGDN